MIELPEAFTIARQLDEVLKGKEIISANGGNSPHRWVFHKPSREAFEKKPIGCIA